MIDPVRNRVITRTPAKMEEFIEYLTSDAGGWSTDIMRAYKFSNEGVQRTIGELRQGQEKNDYVYDHVMAP